MQDGDHPDSQSKESNEDEINKSCNRIQFSFFNLIYEVNKLHIYQSTFYFPRLLMVIIQLLALSYWPLFTSPQSDGKIRQTDISVFQNVLEKFTVFVSFSLSPLLEDYTLSRIITLSTVCGILLIFCIFSIFYIRRNFRIPNTFLYISFFLLQILAPIFYLPTILTFSISILYVANGELKDIVIFLLFFILSVLYSCLMHYSLSSFTYVASPNNSLFASFDNNCTKLIYLNAVFIIVFSYISIRVGNWFRIVSISIHILFSLFMVFYTTRFHYLSILANVLVCSFFVFSFANDIFALIWCFDVNCPDVIRILIPILIYIIAYFVFSGIFMKYLRYMHGILTNENFNINSDEYIGLASINKIYEIKRLVRIGFLLNSRAIFDGNILLFFSRKFEDAELWYISASIFSLIPSQRDLFYYSFSEFKKLHKNNFVNKSRYFSLQKLDKNRNFVASHEFDLENVTYNAINAVHDFWLRLGKYNEQIRIKDLCNVADQVKLASYKWNELLLMHPNEQSFLELYSTYQIECLGKIENGVRILIHSEQNQNENRQAEIDELFKTFIITKPRLLKEGIVDETGNLLKNTKDKKEDNAYQVKFTEGYYEIRDRANQMFKWSQHRVQLGKATSHYRPWGYYFFRFLSIFVIVLWLAFIITEFVLAYLTFPEYNSIYERSIDFIKMQDSFSMSHSLLLLEYATSLHLLFSKPQYQNRLGELIKYNVIDPFNLDYSLDSQAKIAQQSIYDILVGLSEHSLCYDEFHIVVQQLVQPKLSMAYCTFNIFTNSMLISQRNSSLRQAIMSLLWYQQSFDGKSELNINDPTFCELNFLYYNIPFAIFDVIYKLDQTLDINYKTDIKDWNNFMIAIDIISICLFLPFYILPTILIRHEIHKSLNAIRSISKEGAIEATKLISIENKHFENDSNEENKETNVCRKKYYISVILSYFVPLLLIIIVFIFMNVAIALLKKTLKNDVAYQKDQHAGALRLPMISDLLSLGILEIINNNLNLEYVNDSRISSKFLNLIALINGNHSYYLKTIVNSHKNLQSLHYDAQCPTSMFNCLSLSDELIYFLSNSLRFLNNSFSLDSDDFIELLYIGSTDLHKKLSKSIKIDSNIQNDIIRRGKIEALLLLSISILILVLLIILSIYFNNVLLKILKTAMLLIRHIPPPFIADSSLMIQLLKGKQFKNRNQIRNTSELIFENTSTPFLFIGEGFLIEAVNKAFENNFGLTNDQLIGHSLQRIIPKPASGELYYSSEEQGAYHLFEKMESAKEHGSTEPISYDTLCIQDDNGVQNFVSVKTTVYPVRKNDTQQTDQLNFVCMIQPKSVQEQKKLQNAKIACDALLNQLIPRDIANYTGGANDFKFITKNVTLIAVKIKNIQEIISTDINDFAKIISFVENLAKKNPPFLLTNIAYDTIFLVAGLMQDSDVVLQSGSALSLLFPLKEQLGILIPTKSNEKRFAIGVVYGGPVLSGIVRKANPHFVVSGAIFDEVSELCSACDDDEIIVSQDFKNAVVCSTNTMNFDRIGPLVNGQSTYLL